MYEKAIITQSNYIPWKGYFDSIAAVDVFIVYDDMQYTKRDWRNRNLIKTPQGLSWLSIPVEVKGKYFQKIKDTKIADKSWSEQHWNVLKTHYKKAPHFNAMAEWIEPLYKNCSFDYLTEVNMHFIRAINSFLNINTEIKFSSDFVLHEERTMRMVNICKELGVKKYYSGPAAKAYMDEQFFTQNGIEVHYWDYSGYPEYPQILNPFEHGVSILDLIFNTGEESVKYLKFSHETIHN